MKTFTANHYRDPLDVLIEQESRTCKGCKWLARFVVFGEPKMVCDKNRKRRNDKCYEESQGINCTGGK